MGNNLQDLRYALRVLRNSPGFTAVAVATLGLGIAANTTVFGWIDTILLRPIPGVARASELVALEEIRADGGITSCAHPDFRDYQRQMTLASGVVATHTVFFNIGPTERRQRVVGQVVSANFFDVLGVQPFLGRVFSPEEDKDVSGAQPIVVVSHRLWRNYFRSDPGVVGKGAFINGRQFTVIGIAPPEFGGSVGGARLDVWVPLSMIVQIGGLNTWAAADRNAKFLDVIVRMKAGVTIEQARDETKGIAARIAAEYPDTHRGVTASLVPIWQASYGLQATLLNPLRILMVVCVLVLLIACANVTNLLMARSVTRQREFAVRMALGAGRGTLIRQLLAEVLIVSGAGAVVGVILAQWMSESMNYLFPSLGSAVRSAIEPLLRPQMNLTAFGFAIVVAFAAAIAATLLPALHLRRVDVNETLKEGGRGGTSGARTHRARGALVVMEVALASMALIGAGLAIRSFEKFSNMNPGFDSRNVLVAHFHLSNSGYTLAQERQFCRSLRLRLEAAPGIERVAYADSAPLSLFFGPGSERIRIEGEADQDAVVSVLRSIVAPGYFDLMRIPLVEGRDFTEQDDSKAQRVIIVNQTFAKRFFDGKSPIGRKVRVSNNWSTVIGMVKDGKYRNLPEGQRPYFYGPFQQIFYSGNANLFYIRTSGDPDGVRTILRREVAALDARAAGLFDVAPLTEHVQSGLFAEKVVAALLTGLGLLSLMLAAVGLYSVMAYSVTERTHEIGIRMALGARPRAVLGMVLRKGLLMTMGGLTAGVAMTIAGVRALSSTINVPVSLADPLVFGIAALFLIVVAFVASYVPARRATRVDPLVTLRSE